MKRLTEDDLITLRDTFSDLAGNPLTDDISDDEVFPIAAGPWPGIYVGAIQVRCAACKAFAGISPKGYRLSKANPMRLIFCSSCFVALHNLMRENADSGQ
jgi:hypothetical protein